MDPNSNGIVQFDVCGRLFKTSRSLIDKHEGTMLSRLVSDTWQEDPTKPVFIDRDGDIFAQVLNFLRYGSITLPEKMVKDMFLRDLDFYEIVPGEGSVKTASEAWAVQVKDRRSEISQLTSRAASLTLRNDIEFLANHCASCYLNGQTKVSLNPTSSQPNIEQLYKAAKAVIVNQESLSELLSNFGLRLKNINCKNTAIRIQFDCCD